jgi:amino acid permease
MGAKPSRSVTLAVGGCLLGSLLTLLIWFFAVLAMYGVAGGDCFPQFSSSCPSDHERNVRILVIALVALGINVLGFVLIGRALAQYVNTED